MSDPHPSRLVEDYLTLIWKAQEWPSAEPSTTDLARQLGVTASTVSANLKKLNRQGLIEYQPYGRIRLTPAGSDIAVPIVRRHRLIETYLVQRLGLGWDEVHEEADRLEHAVSELVLDRMDDALGHPENDPHGDPIPKADGTVPAIDDQALPDAPSGIRVQVSRVRDRSPEVLRHLEGVGIRVNRTLTVQHVNREAGVVRVEIDATPVDLSLTAADAVRVARS